MSPLQLKPEHQHLHVLCLGAHSDDIEIGCAGTLLKWLAEYPAVHVTWVVLSAAGARGLEARRSAKALLRRAASLDIVLGGFADTELPAHGAQAKALLREVATRCTPDVVLTHRLEDRHQDHRMLAELTWQVWRNHLVLEYEVPKYEGDLGQPNVFVPLPKAMATRKLRHLMTHFASQRGKDWFNPATFSGLMALRAVECRAAAGQAEAFHARKLTL
jgi:LmbE family N-acetylglucosaminyl deacetylase